MIKRSKKYKIYSNTYNILLGKRRLGNPNKGDWFLFTTDAKWKNRKKNRDYTLYKIDEIKHDIIFVSITIMDYIMGINENDRQD